MEAEETELVGTGQGAEIGGRSAEIWGEAATGAELWARAKVERGVEIGTKAEDEGGRVVSGGVKAMWETSEIGGEATRKLGICSLAVFVGNVAEDGSGGKTDFWLFASLTKKKKKKKNRLNSLLNTRHKKEQNMLY